MRVAAGDDDACLLILAHEPLDELSPFLVGRFGDGASVNHADVGRFALGAALHAALREHCAHGGGFGEVELAAQRMVLCLQG